METFRKGEYSRFQALSHVANELGKWAGVSDKERGKAFDSYLAEINSFAAVQNEERSETRGASPPVGASFSAGQQSNGKWIREEVEDLLDQVSRGELDEEIEPCAARKRAREEDMPWYNSTSNSS